VLVCIAFVAWSELQTPVGPSPLTRQVATSNDVAWLERLCSDHRYAEEQFARRGANTGGVKQNRSAAYVRLGAIGSPESLAAVGRIEKLMRDRSVLPAAAEPGAPVYHPAPHMSDSILRSAAETALADGRAAAAYILDWYGPQAVFLALRSHGSWSRPSMVPAPLPQYVFVKIALQGLPGGRLRFALSGAEPRGDVPAIHPTPDAFEVALAEVERDTDGDGWTDIAERHLGLDWRKADSDGDGIADGVDAAPDFGALQAPNDEEAVILRTAIFAMFGLTESPAALVVADNSRRVHPFGLPGPLLYTQRQVGVRVTWKITAKSADAATVEITDYEGPLAASGNDVGLKKIGSDWYVVSIKMKWIS